MAKFDAKSFNDKAFGTYMSAVPNVKLNKLRESRAIVGDKRLRETFVNNTQTGTVYAVIPYFGILGGTPQNYDGVQNLTPEKTDTYEQGVFTFGRMNGWTEADFSYDVTGGVDFMANVRNQITNYWNEQDQGVQLAILKGLFSISDTGSGAIKAANAEFVTKHTHDITNGTGEAALMGATTLNTAIQKACGDHKNLFRLVFCHSVVATGLENLKLLAYLKYTDAQGIERNLEMGTWNGRLVVIEDSMPTEERPLTYKKTTDTALVEGKAYYTRSGSSSNYVYTLVAEPDVVNIGSYYEVDTTYTAFTTYALGEGAISWEDVGAKVPYEMVRDAKLHGGEDTLISRKRKAVSVAGMSYLKASQATNSPTDAELMNGINWSLVNNGDGKTISHKAVPIARIISRG